MPWIMAYEWTPRVIAILPLISTAHGLWTAGKISTKIHPAEVVNQVKDFGDESYAADLDALLAWVAQAQVHFVFGALVFLSLSIAFVAFSYMGYCPPIMMYH